MKTIGMASGAEEIQAEAVLRSVPDWAGRRIRYAPATAGIASPSHRAVDSQSWVVGIDDAAPAYFLKILHADQRDFIDVAAAFAAAQKAAALGCTPRPLHCLPEKDAAVFDYLPASWRTARMDDLRRADILEKTIAAKKALHGMAPLDATWTVFDRIRMLDDALRTAKIEAGADGWWMRSCVGDIEDAVLAAGHDAKPSHADGVASNVMIGPDGTVQLVDFDEARNADPFYEIGILLNEAFQFESEMRQGLEIFAGTFRQEQLNRCRIYAIADDFMWGLWGTLMNAVSPRGSVEFLKYAQWRLLRCRMALRHPGFEEKLRYL